MVTLATDMKLCFHKKKAIFVLINDPRVMSFYVKTLVMVNWNLLRKLLQVYCNFYTPHHTTKINVVFILGSKELNN